MARRARAIFLQIGRGENRWHVAQSSECAPARRRRLLRGGDGSLRRRIQTRWRPTVLYPIYASTFIFAALISWRVYGIKIRAVHVAGMLLLIAGMYLLGR